MTTKEMATEFRDMAAQYLLDTKGSEFFRKAAARLEAADGLLEAARKAQNALQHLASITDETRAGWALKALTEAIAEAEKNL